MLSRALSLAAVLLLIGSFVPKPALAQENLDAGKTPSQIFAGTCNACHKSPRGLLKTVSPSSLPGFLRQHYTTSPNMAGVLSSYLVSNGATDTRMGGDGPKGAKEGAKGAKEGAKEGARQEAKQEPRPSGAPEQLDRWGRRVHPPGAPQEASAPAGEQKPDAADTQPPAQAAVDHGAEGRKMSPKQKLSKRGKPSEALPKEEPAVEPKGEPKSEAKGEAKNEPKTEPKTEPKSEPKSEPKGSETATRDEGKQENKPEAVKPPEEGRPQSAKIEQPADTSVSRPDPVPQVTPAGHGGAGAPAGASGGGPSPAAPGQTAPLQTAISPPATELAVPLSSNASPPPPPPAVTASAPPPPPVQPAGPPLPPISQ
jgi:hypothetical protein